MIYSQFVLLALSGISTASAESWHQRRALEHRLRRRADFSTAPNTLNGNVGSRTYAEFAIQTAVNNMVPTNQQSGGSILLTPTTDLPAGTTLDSALQQCSSLCDGYLTAQGTTDQVPCLAFTVSTVYSNLACSLLSQEYSSTTANEWTTPATAINAVTYNRQPPKVGCESLGNNPSIQSGLWDQFQLQAYMQELQKYSNLGYSWSTYSQSGFLHDFMQAAGWNNWQCNNFQDFQNGFCTPQWYDDATCESNLLAWPILNLFNYWSSIYNGYVQADVDISKQANGITITEHYYIAPNQGGSSWATAAVGILSDFLGFAPDGFSAISGIISLTNDVMSSTASSYTGSPFNSALDLWDTLYAPMDTALTNMATSISTTFTANISSFDPLYEILSSSGTTLMDGNDGDFLFDYNTYLNQNLLPWLKARVASGSMQLQNIFLLSIPFSVSNMYPTPGDCNAALPQTCQNLNSLGFSTNGCGPGQAWCIGDTQMVFPMRGDSPTAMYQGIEQAWNEFPNTDNIVSVQTLTNSASECYSGFTPGQNAITLYSPAASSLNLGNTTLDVSSPCVWTTPICDWGSWSGSYQQSIQDFINDNGYDGQDADLYQAYGGPYIAGEDIATFSSWCAYQFGFQSSWSFTPTTEYNGLDNLGPISGTKYMSVTKQ